MYAVRRLDFRLVETPLSRWAVGPQSVNWEGLVLPLSSSRREETVLGTSEGVSRGPAPRHAANRLKVIWLILPVVICLFERLSHACLSSHCITVKPRMAH